MKKLIFTTLILGLLASCNIDDVESDLIPVADNSATTETDCVPDNPPSVLGRLYLRSSYIIDTPVDVDGDGIFSTDLMEEQLCFDLSLNFDESFRVSNPTFDAVSLYVDDDGNGNLSQRMNCSHADGTANTYIQVGNTIKFFYGNDLQFTGTLSANETKLTFTFPNELLFGFNFFEASNRILNQDGTITEYEGDAVVTYTLQ
jgi:hypothetical protein